MLLLISDFDGMRDNVRLVSLQIYTFHFTQIIVSVILLYTCLILLLYTCMIQIESKRRVKIK